MALPLPSGSPVQEAAVALLQGTVMRHSFCAAAVQPSSLAANTSCSAQPEEEGSQPEGITCPVQLWRQGQSPTLAAGASLAPHSVTGCAAEGEGGRGGETVIDSRGVALLMLLYKPVLLSACI